MVSGVSIQDGEHHGETSGDDVARLVQQALKGDLKAFEGLVSLFQRQANAVVYRLLNNVDDAMEVTQDAFVKAYDKLSTLSNPRQFGPWLMRIAGNLALNRRRARALRATVPIDVGDEEERGSSIKDPSAYSPMQNACANEAQAAIAAALEDLPEIQRDALVMFSIGKVPQKDVAKALGCSVEAVKWHVFSARKKLKDKLAGYL